MPVQPINPAPGADIFNDFYNAYLETIQEIAVTASLNSTPTGMELVLTKYGGGQLTVNFPASEDKILTGLATNISGAGPYNINWAAGTYQLNSSNYSIGAGSLAIPVADPTLDRIDVLVVNDSGAAQYIAGTPSANPSSPTIAANQLLVSVITVPSQASGGAPGGSGPSLILPPGPYNGAVLQWSSVAGEWKASSSPLKAIWTDALLYSGSDEIFLRTQNGGGNGIFANAASTALFYKQSTNDFIMLVLNTGISSIIQTSGTEVKHFFDIDGGVKFRRSTPSDVIDTLYIDANGVLHYGGDVVCIAPCGAGGANVDPGTIEGQVLRWDNSLLKWKPATDALLTSILMQIEREQVLLTGGIPAATADMQLTQNSAILSYFNALLSSLNQYTIDVNGFIFEQGDSNEAKLQLDLDGGIEFVRNGAPAITTNRLYRIGNVLYFDGAPVDKTGSLPVAFITGQMLRWNNVTGLWEIANGTSNTLDEFRVTKQFATIFNEVLVGGAAAETELSSSDPVAERLSRINVSDTRVLVTHQNDSSGTNTDFSVSEEVIKLSESGTTSTFLDVDVGGG